jgi:hypothetical protein
MMWHGLCLVFSNNENKCLFITRGCSEGKLIPGTRIFRVAVPVEEQAHMKPKGSSSQFGVPFAAVISAPVRQIAIALSVSFALFLLTFGSSAEAGPTFTACVVGPLDGLPGCVSTPGSIPMRDGFQHKSIGSSSSFSGSATSDLGTRAESTPLGLKARSGTLFFADGTRGAANGGGSGYAAVLYDDFRVSASGASFIPGSLNLFLSGSASANINDATANRGLTANGFASAGVIVGMTVNGIYVEGGATQLISPAGSSYSTYGPLADLTFPALFKTPVLSLPVGTPFSLLLELTVVTGATGVISGTPEDEFANAHFFLDALADFSSTLTFPTSGPVFNLPEGATVDSLSALIVNNQFVGAGPAGAGVAEPSTLFLLALGVVALARRASKRA